MKEINLDIGKAVIIKTKYNYAIKIGRGNAGYFILSNNSKKGPFSRVFIYKENIIGIFQNLKYIYKIEPQNFVLSQKEEIGVINFDNCRKLGEVNDYIVFIDDSIDKFFIVNKNTYLPTSEDFPKFDDYDDLLDYYRDKKIYLDNRELQIYARKMKRFFIDFEYFYNYLENLDISKLSEEILFDIACNREIFKKIFSFEKNNILKLTKSDNKAKELIEKGYIESKHTGIENLSIEFSNEFTQAKDILKSIIPTLKNSSTDYLRTNSGIDFKLLPEYINRLSINDLSISVQKEISAKRPLTCQIYDSIIIGALKHMQKDNPSIKDGYLITSNFKSVFNDEYENFKKIAEEKLGDLYNQYFQSRKNLVSHC